jgi:hypothetical protein
MELNDKVRKENFEKAQDATEEAKKSGQAPPRRPKFGDVYLAIKAREALEQDEENTLPE